MKIYKTYFDKSDTPFRQEFQPKKKYHIVWKRLPYTTFLGHKTVKVRLFGLFTVNRKTLAQHFEDCIIKEAQDE